MARTLTEIYTTSKRFRDAYLESTEKKISNGSKMSVLDAFTWATSACIWAFECVMDVFKVDLADDMNHRINGTPAYFSKQLLNYQDGDELAVSNDGSIFFYPTIDEGKRIISKVSYSEMNEEGFNDKKMVFKVASGEPGSYHPVTSDQLVRIKSYLNQILFAGQHCQVVSRKGDVFVPRLTVYYDGAVSANEVYNNIEDALTKFFASLDFDGIVYAQKIIDCIQSAEHVVDVFIGPEQGIFVVQYDDDNNIIMAGDSKEHKVSRFFIPNSGYVRQSELAGEESDIPVWKETIILQIENNQ